jgi:DNA-binding CsgD family transcriptional regulator
MWTSAAPREIDQVPFRRVKELEHAPTSPDLLSARAVAADASSTRSAELDRIWGELVLGQCLVVSTFFADHRSFLVMSDTRGRKKAVVTRHVPRRHLELLEPVLLGSTQKAVALEAGMSVSTVSTCLKVALGIIGLTCPASKVPPVIVALVSAARSSTGAVGRESLVTEGTRRYRVISIERPDLALSSLLSPAEYEAIRLLIEGKHHEEIAQERRASPRTVANQIGSAFRKLGVSGRSELLAGLAHGGLPTLRPELGAVDTSA